MYAADSVTITIIDKTLLSLGESMGGLFLPVKGYFLSESKDWRWGWERKGEHRPLPDRDRRAASAPQGRQAGVCDRLA
jgi:hypothetical protein